MKRNAGYHNDGLSKQQEIQNSRELKVGNNDKYVNLN